MDAISRLRGLAFAEEKIAYQGQEFIVREMNAKDKTVYETGLYDFKQNGKTLQAIPKMEGSKSKLVVYTLHDLDGTRIFKGLEDLPLIDDLPSAFVDLVAETAAKLTGLNQEQVTKN